MADNAFVKIGTALLKHQVKKLVGEETLGVLSEELADIGGDKLDAWLGDKFTLEEIEKAAKAAEACFHDSVEDHDLEQWMVSLPIGDLPKVVEAIEKLPTSPDEKELEEAIRHAVAGWRKLSPEQIEQAVSSFLTCLRSALLPIEKQTLMVIGHSVLRTEDKVDLLVRWFEQYIITGKSVEVKQLNPEPNEGWYLAHPYPMPPNFTGRVEERKMLADWLNKDSDNRLFVLRALGGFGKSALSWHWLTHDVDSNDWKKVVFWSFYEGDASFEHFIEETLKYLKLEVPQGTRPQVDDLLKAMQGQKILLIMDGFERALRAYSSMNAAYQGDESPLPEGEGQGEGSLDCVNINAEIFLKSVCSLPNIKSKVLMTTRLTPRAVKPHGEFLQGCREVELTVMQKEDAVLFFHKQKIKGTHAEIEAACAPYGYHPLSLRLLAGRILKDFENPADIIVAEQLKIDGDIIQQKHHVLKVSYDSLPKHEQKLLNTIACFRSPVELKMLQSITEDKKSLNADLHNLISRGLLHFDEENKRFDLHPIVRRYAYEHLTALDRTATHVRLRDYFAAIEVPNNPKTMNDLSSVIELYYHLVKANQPEKATELFGSRLLHPLHYQFGAYHIIIELMRCLFIEKDDTLLPSIDQASRPVILSTLAVAYGESGQPQKSIPLFEQQIAIRERQDVQEAIAIGRENIAEDQIHIGALREAESNLRLSIQLSQKLLEQSIEAITHAELGRLLAYRGVWLNASKELDRAEKFLKKETHNQIGVIKLYYALLYFIMSHDITQTKTNNKKYVIEYAKRGLDLIEKNALATYPVARDLIRAHWLVGIAYRLNGDFDSAERYISEALSRCRFINSIIHEADILLAFARLRFDQKNYEEAKSLADEALLITERCGYVLQGADVNLFLAQYALEQEKDKTKAKQYAEEAKKLATCDGPPYYYKVAYEEAERLLKDLGG